MQILYDTKFWKYCKAHPKRCLLVSIFIIWYYFSLPKQLFQNPTSTIVEASNGTLLGGKIATDGQWRFPETDSIPEKIETCLLAFEDQYFYKHFGFNPVAIGKALFTNINARKVVRGGSTITQQVIRLSRQGKSRTYIEKLIELIQATRLEFRYSKKEILNLYASHAPFGGNVVGLDMASWRYFGQQPYQLSWAESATLAVLPNAPSLIYPGKNQIRLKNKRDRLLNKLLSQHTIDTLTYDLAISEPLPQRPFPLPQLAPHLTIKLSKTNAGQRLKTTIDRNLQFQVNKIVNRHYQIHRQNGVHNMAVLVLDVDTRQVLSYVGNTPTNLTHQKDVDIITASRSTGSLLKPLLYSTMMDKGELLPDQLVADVPTTIAGYAPENYSKTYAGAVPASQALARSLNIPAVRLLQRYGLHRFKDELESYHIKGLSYSADHYGLSLIVGGAEGSLWDLCKVYAGYAGTLKHYNTTSSEYYTNEFANPILLKNKKVDFGTLTKQKPIVGAGSLWLTLDAMQRVNRPEGDEAWQFYDSSRKIAWKTGTSFGNRDAWAIGITSKYVVGVWVGNADGEGRPELTGLHAAAPVLFDVFNLLPRSSWFATPYDDLTSAQVCQKSGFLARELCPKKETLIPILGTTKKPCRYHQLVHLDKSKQFQVNSSCESVQDIVHESRFVLPPLQAYYYKNQNSEYTALPPYRIDCKNEAKPPMEFIFPKTDSQVHITKSFEGKQQEVILKIAHETPENSVFWYLNDQYLGATKEFHEMPILPKDGTHRITVIDTQGFEIQRTLVVRNEG